MNHRRSIHFCKLNCSRQRDKRSRGISIFGLPMIRLSIGKQILNEIKYTVRRSEILSPRGPHEFEKLTHITHSIKSFCIIWFFKNLKLNWTTLSKNPTLEPFLPRVLRYKKMYQEPHVRVYRTRFSYKKNQYKKKIQKS